VTRLALAVLLFTPSAFAQSAQLTSESGLHRAAFHLPAGTVRLNLPGDLTAGDHIIGTVFTEPSGRDRAQQEKNEKELAAYAIDIGGHLQFQGNRIFWSVPPASAPGSNVIRLRDRTKKLVAECQLPILPAVPSPGLPPSIDLPSGGPAGGFLSVWGTLPGDAVASLRIGGKDAALIAQSPRKAVFFTPREALGATTIEARAGSLSAAGPYQGLGLNLAASRRDLLSGQSAELTVTVLGLSGLEDEAHLVITNLTPTVAAMEGGIAYQVIIRAADVSPDGTFVVLRRLVALQNGTFDIAASVTRPPLAQLPVAGLAATAIARWSLRNGIEITPTARDLMVAGVNQARSALDDFLRAQLPFGSNAGDLLLALISEYCFDLRNRILNPALGVVRPRRLPRFAYGFQASPQAAVVIDGPAVQKRTFLQFLGDLLSRMTPGGGWGAILVASQPPQQPFTIDRASGITVQTFSATVGPHTVTVGACVRQVQVVANQTTQVSCVLTPAR